MTIINENPDLKMLYDFYDILDVDYDESGDYLIIAGEKYEIEINLSDKVADSQSCRVNIGGEYYYFG